MKFTHTKQHGIYKLLGCLGSPARAPPPCGKSKGYKSRKSNVLCTDCNARLIMAGLWTEVCLAQTVLGALKDGFDVYFVSDASGGVRGLQ